MITANVIYRVFRLKVGLETGTAFTIEEEDREYLVTARHVAYSLPRIHRFIQVDGVRTAEGCEGVTGAIIRA